MLGVEFFGPSILYLACESVKFLREFNMLHMVVYHGEVWLSSLKLGLDLKFVKLV